MLLHQPDKAGTVGSGAEVKSQVARRLLQTGVFWQEAQGLQPQVVSHLLKHLSVALAAHLIKYNAGNTDVATEAYEAAEQCCHGIGRRAGVDHQHYRQP